MHDKGGAFWSGRGMSQCTKLLDELGIDQVVAGAKEHNGKVEVFNANGHKELFDRHRFWGVAEMKRRLAAHLHWYDHGRTHHALGGLLVPADRSWGRAEEVRARIESGASREGDELALGERCLDLFEVVSRGGVPENGRLPPLRPRASRAPRRAAVARLRRGDPDPARHPGGLAASRAARSRRRRAHLPTSEATVLKVEALLDAWRRWSGSALAPFGEHVREHLRLGFSDALIGRLLFEHGARTPKRRPGRTPDEEALRGAFETFFAGAQWAGDGTGIEVLVDGRCTASTLELMVDAHTGAIVGLDVTETEDNETVVAAYGDGTDTTGPSPLAVLLDNKPCNHTEVVDTGSAATCASARHRTARRTRLMSRAPSASSRSASPSSRWTPRSRTSSPSSSPSSSCSPSPAREPPASPRSSRPEPRRALRRARHRKAAAKARLQARLDKQERARRSRAARPDLAVREIVDRVCATSAMPSPRIPSTPSSMPPRSWRTSASPARSPAEPMPAISSASSTHSCTSTRPTPSSGPSSRATRAARPPPRAAPYAPRPLEDPHAVHDATHVEFHGATSYARRCRRRRKG